MAWLNCGSKVAEWRGSALSDLAEQGVEWAELTALYLKEHPSGRAPRLYERMRELRGITTGDRDRKPWGRR